MEETIQCCLQNHVHHGLKRSGSHSWEDCHKASKCKHQSDTFNNGDKEVSNGFNMIRNSNVPPSTSAGLLNNDLFNTGVSKFNRIYLAIRNVKILRIFNS